MLELLNINNIKWTTSNWTYIMTEHDYVLKKNFREEIELPKYLPQSKYTFSGNEPLAYDLIYDIKQPSKNVWDSEGNQYTIHDYALTHTKDLAKIIDKFPNEWAISEISLKWWLKDNELLKMDN